MAKHRRLCSLIYSIEFLVGGSWFLLCALFLAIVAVAVAASGTGNGVGGEPSSTSTSTSTSKSCLTGWSGNSETTIPEEWINDGYCDCPFDGKDEPNTNACSGSLSWAGVDAAISEPPTTGSTDFVCPQQPNVVLPMSRLYDGICDCCDGSDEDPNLHNESTNTNTNTNAKRNPCPNDCDRVLRAEREKQARIRNEFRIGSQKRAVELSRFSKLRAQKNAEAFGLEQKLKAIEADIEDIEGTQIVRLKEAYAVSKFATLKDSVANSPMAKALLSGLATEELSALLVHLCQVSGEIAKSEGRDEHESTCLALRVAALDLGLTWSDDDDEGTVEATFHETIAPEIVPIVFRNALEAHENGGSRALLPLRWKQHSKKKKKQNLPRSKDRRRLDEIEFGDDDAYGKSLGMDDDDFVIDDDYRLHEENYDDGDHTEEEHYDDSDIPQEDDSLGSNGGEVSEDSSIRKSLFSDTRFRFLKESQYMLEEITKILEAVEANSKKDKDNDNDNGNDTDGDSNKDTNEETSSETDEPQGDENEAKLETNSDFDVSIDPAKYMTFRNSLRKMRGVVETGFSWGASVELLLGALSTEEGKRETLERLVIGTILYGQVSAVQVWKILQFVLQDFKVLYENNQAEASCAFIWAGNCPPRRANANANPQDYEYPPSFLLEVAKGFCDEEASSFANRGAQNAVACQRMNDIKFNTNGNTNSIKDVIESLVSLDSEQSLDYFGYSVPTGRHQDNADPFQRMFAPIMNLSIDAAAKAIRALEETRDTKETEHRNLKKDIDALWKDIGGRDGTALGREGELHSIADKCLDIVAGKYTYELCLFGKAQQKEGKSKSGTNLGQWKGIEYVGKSTRLLKWENGAKCWNGPKRSATVIMKCGAENKVVSADEPDTCKYVFVMESYMACDEAYKQEMGL